MIEFNSSSGPHLSILFFGGELKEKVLVPDLDELGNHKKYKTGDRKGELKYKYEEQTLKIKGVRLKPKPELETKKNGVYKTDESILKLIAKRSNHDAGKIALLMLKIRELNKQIGTYYEGTEKFIHDFDNCVHHELCHFGYDKKDRNSVGGGVITGRLSGQKPNMLNQPKSSDSKVREHFIPKNGVWVSADWAQIEPCTQAELTRDPNLIQEINDGIDKHCMYLSLKEHLPYEVIYKKCKIEKIPEWDAKRSKIKGFTFAKAYGAGIKKIALDTGMTEKEVKELFEVEKKRYPVMMQYQERNKRKVEACGELQTIFGRILKFKKYPAPQWLQDKGIQESYKPQEIINWPIQSIGSGDLTLIMIGYFWRKYAIHNRDKYLMINTVYDSLDLDCKSEFVEELKIHLKCLTDVKEVCKKYFSYLWVVPVKIDVKIGDSWYAGGL